MLYCPTLFLVFMPQLGESYIFFIFTSGVFLKFIAKVFFFARNP